MPAPSQQAPPSWISFQVVAVETWESDDQITDFRQSLREFEREAKLEPARLAIGFTSQYEFRDVSIHVRG